jgi:hypothetical protein
MIYSFIDEWLEVAEKHNATVKRILSGPSIIDRTHMQLEMVYMYIPYKYSEIIISSGESDSIKINFDFNIDTGFRFLIYQEDYMDKIGKLFDMVKEITIQDKDFDSKFIIQTNDSAKMGKFLDEYIKEYLLLRYGYLANFKLDAINNSMVLTLNAPFNERNMEMMEKTIQFIKYAIDKIASFNRC